MKCYCGHPEQRFRGWQSDHKEKRCIFVANGQKLEEEKQVRPELIIRRPVPYEEGAGI